jgi:elongation factor P--(R)-beta-lysine ligase
LPTDHDFRPAASWAALRRRAELLKASRAFFDERGYLEVETPLLAHDTVIDRHLDPLPVTLFADPRFPHTGEKLWLQTSPEFGMKRLLAAGGPSMYQITRAFRGGEWGPLHNPEFTMLEWYGVGDDYSAAMQLLSDLAERLLERGPAERVTFRETFRKFAGVDPLVDGQAALEDACQARSVALPDAYDRDLLLDALLTSVVEPQLGRARPTIVCDYPASQAALARIRDDNPPVAERFELYVDGIELVNGYHELLDAAVLRERNRVNNELRRADGKSTSPEESRLLAAMEHGLPACSGCALGFDRLVMVSLGASSLAEVMAFPIDRA